MNAAIQTRGLSKTYKNGKIQALKPLDLEVPYGSVFGLLGPNGAGKSTLVKALLSIVHASAGEAEILGKNFKHAACRKKVGYLPEGHHFPSYLKGREVCEYFGKLSGLRGHKLKTEVAEKLRLVGMHDWSNTKISKYSKGMKQRIGLAQALLGNPELVFLDEPTDGVDPLGRKEIRDFILGVARTHSITFFINSHLLSEIELMCDQVAILHQGSLVQQGSIDDVKNAIAHKHSGNQNFEVIFKTSSLPQSLWQELQKEGASQLGQDSFITAISDQAAISQLVDRLRSENVLIYGIEQKVLSLEDAFVSLIQSDPQATEHKSL